MRGHHVLLSSSMCVSWGLGVIESSGLGGKNLNPKPSVCLKAGAVKGVPTPCGVPRRLNLGSVPGRQCCRAGGGSIVCCGPVPGTTCVVLSMLSQPPYPGTLLCTAGLTTCVVHTVTHSTNACEQRRLSCCSAGQRSGCRHVGWLCVVDDKRHCGFWCLVKESQNTEMTHSLFGHRVELGVQDAS